jgi:hypothetical protein
VAGQFKLDLDGGLEKMETASSEVTIHGKNNLGEYVTLLNCFLRRSTGGLFPESSTRSSSYFVNHVLVGGLFLSTDDVQFQRVSFGVHLLDEWRCANAFNMNEVWRAFRTGESSQAPIYQKPEPLVLATVGGIGVTLEFEVSLPGSNIAQTKMTLEHCARVVMESTGKPLQLFDTIGDNSTESFISTIDDLIRFFTFATSEKTFPYDIQGNVLESTRRGSRKKITKPIRIFLPCREIPQSLPKPDFYDMDLQYKDIAMDPIRYIENWFRMIPNLKTPISRYLDVVSGSTEYLETQALSLCIAAEGYHRTTHPDLEVVSPEHKIRLDEILSSTSIEHRDWLENRLQHSHAPTLRKRFKDLIRRYPKTVKWLVGSKKERNALIDWATTHRNDYSHGKTITRQAEKSGHTLQMYYRTQYLRALLFMCILSELGYTQAEVDRILRENQHFSQVASRRDEPRDPKKIHLRGKRGKWIVRAQGGLMNHQYKTKKRAIEEGRAMAQERRGILYVYNEDDSLQKTHAYDGGSSKR